MTGFLVSASLILSGPGFVPEEFGAIGTGEVSIWHEGEPVSTRSSKRHSDSGVKIVLLTPAEEFEWVEQLEAVLADLCPKLIARRPLLGSIVPHLSIYVETDGATFPPMFFSEKFLTLVAGIDAEMDVDIVQAL